MATAAEMKLDRRKLDQLCINSIRVLAIDAVQKANSGHPGMPMGMAPVAYVLWTRFLRHNPKQSEMVRARPLCALGRARLDAALQPALPDRLRPHARRSQAFPPARQQDARPSGEPSHPGVETTTGPLGQGFGNGVGMAIAAKHMEARFDARRGRLRPPDFRDRQRRRHDGGDLQRGGVRSPVIWDSAISFIFMTTIM